MWECNPKSGMTGDMARWSEPAFRDRVKKRAHQLGLSLGTLLGRAGVSEDLLRRVPKTYGRSISSIEKIADACGWTLAQAIGIDAPASHTDAARIHLALIAADRTISDNMMPGPKRLAVMADLAGYAYDLLSGWASSGSAVDEQTSLRMVEVALRRRFANPDLKKS
jgi:hypothetical protein